MLAARHDDDDDDDDNYVRFRQIISIALWGVSFFTFLLGWLVGWLVEFMAYQPLYVI